MLKCDIKEPEPQTIACYIGGLKESIVDAIHLQPYWTFNDVRKLANNVEKQQLNESKKSKSSSFRRPNYSNQGNSNNDSNLETPTKGNFLNSSSNSEVKEKKVSRNVTKRRCFKCQGIGHLQANCPNRKAIMYIGDQLIELENDEDEPKDNHLGGDDVDENIYLDEGEFLVIQRSLHSDIQKEEPDSEMHCSTLDVHPMERCL